MLLLLVTPLDLPQPPVFNTVLLSPFWAGGPGKVQQHSSFSHPNLDSDHCIIPCTLELEQVTDPTGARRRSQGVSKARTEEHKSKPDSSIPWLHQHLLVLSPSHGPSCCPWTIIPPQGLFCLTISLSPRGSGFQTPMLGCSWDVLLFPFENQSIIFLQRTLLPRVEFFF